MEYKIGDMFLKDGKTYRVCENCNLNCDLCSFNVNGECDLTPDDMDKIGYCTCDLRQDEKNVYFHELSKTVVSTKDNKNQDIVYPFEEVSKNIYKTYLKCHKSQRELHYGRCLFENMHNIVNGKYSLFIINELKTGGVLYAKAKNADDIFGKFRAYNKDKTIKSIYIKESFGIKQISFQITNQKSNIKCGWFL